MSDNGGSDLDVFDNLSKDAPPARKQTLVGMAVPQGRVSTPPGSVSRTSVPPPPPPSLRVSMPPSSPSQAQADGPEEAEEIDDVEELPSSPEATEDAEEEVTGPIYEADDATQVFSGLSSSVDASEEPPTPLAPTASSPGGASAPSLPPTPPPPTPPPLSSGPPPAPPSRVSTGVSLPPPPSLMRSSGPPPAPPSPSVSQPAPPDWDEDEEDKTTVFNRDSGFGAANMLMGRSQVGSVPIGGLPDAPPPPMSRPSAPIPSPPVIAMPTGHRFTDSSPASVPPAPASKMPLIIGAAAAVALGVALFLILRPSTGGLVVTVAGPGSRPLSGVEVLVDGKVVCTSSPCSLTDLRAGTHMVQARAEGYSQTAETAVLVTGGDDAVHNIRLAQSSGTGLRVTGTGAGLRLHVDGQEVGPLPQELKKMAPGEHSIKISSEHFEPWQKTVTVTEEQLEQIEVPKLKVIKGLAIIKAGENAKGARVVLESDGDRRVLPSLPMNLHINTDKPHKLLATRRGFQPYEQELVFEDGQAEKTFEVTLRREAEEESTSRVVRRSRPAPDPGGSETSTTGQALLNINSIPASQILLDGRPVGRTPLIGVKVSAGPHTVVFVHEGDRATKSVNAAAGKTSTVVHRFK